MRLHVTVVDDDPRWGELHEAVVHRAFRDATVARFTDPAKAVQFVTTHPTDLVVTDYRMPGLCGDGLIMALRRAALPVPTVVMTCDEYALRSDLFAGLGASAVLRKGDIRAVAELIRMLSEIAEGKRAGWVPTRAPEPGS